MEQFFSVETNFHSSRVNITLWKHEQHFHFLHTLRNISSCKRKPPGSEKVAANRGVGLWEVKNVVFVYVAKNKTKCPLTGGVALAEV